MRKQPMDSLWLVPLPNRSSDALGQKTVGRYPYALVHVQSFSGEPWVMPKKKPRCSMPGPPPPMTPPALTERLSIYADALHDQRVVGVMSQHGLTGLRLKCPSKARTTQGRRNQLRAVT